MRIAILSDGVHPYVVGGMQRHTFYLVKYLAQRKINVTLYHFNQSNLDINQLEIFSDEEKEMIESIVIDFPKGDKFPGHYIRSSYNYSELIFENIQSRLQEFDFIYTKGFSGWKLIEEKKKNHLNCPPIGVKFHGYEMFQKQANFKSYLASLLLKNPVKWISLNADYVFSYGSKITEIIKQLGVSNNRIVEIPAGIEVSWLIQSEITVSETRSFVFLGRYERRKGVEELNKALKALIKTNKNFVFHFIGPFEEQLKVKSDKIIYHGKITDNSKIKEILDQSDFLLSPSWSEGMPNVILEGMARACCIICTNVGANSIMVDNSNGRFVEVGNVNDIFEALQWAIDLDMNSVLKMKQHSLNKVQNKLLYQNIIDMFVNSILTIKKNEKNI
jgi:glycosyltransferase involved in cell wall biosynthesis